MISVDQNDESSSPVGIITVTLHRLLQQTLKVLSYSAILHYLGLRLMVLRCFRD